MSVDVSQAWSTVQGMVDGFVTMLPRIVLALVLVGVFVPVTQASRRSDDPAGSERIRARRQGADRRLAGRQLVGI